jgi:hypothetical protein
MSAIRSILEGKDTTIHAVGPEATVLDAVDEMCRSHIGAVLVDRVARPSASSPSETS